MGQGEIGRLLRVVVREEVARLQPRVNQQQRHEGSTARSIIASNKAPAIFEWSARLPERY